MYGAECNMENIFWVSHILHLFRKPLGEWYEKQNMRIEENICQYSKRQRAITTLTLNACLKHMYQELFY